MKNNNFPAFGFVTSLCGQSTVIIPMRETVCITLTVKPMAIVSTLQRLPNPTTQQQHQRLFLFLYCLRIRLGTLICSVLFWFEPNQSTIYSDGFK
jgi:hypothetical protein